MANDSSANTKEVSASTGEPTASTAEFIALGNRFRCIGRLSNHSVVAQLLQLNQQQHRLEAELLLYLGELDRRQLYREQATASAFEFCVSRLGYSEDVAFKRVGAARLMRRFPLIYDLLVTGRIHLTALMLLKPQLTQENHKEWLLLACEKSKRQVEQLVASRCPRPDVPTSIRKLPSARRSPLETNPELAATDRDGLARDNGQASAPSAQATRAQLVTAPASPAQATTTQATGAQLVTAQTTGAQLVTAQAMTAPARDATASTLEPAAARVTPLSSKSYRVTFTANERLKQKLERASELLSHCIHPSDLPALLERALDQLLEREEKRRYGARPSSNPRSVDATFRDSLAHAVQPSNSQPVDLAGELAVEFEHKSCQIVRQEPREAQDPDLAAARIGHGDSSATSLTGDPQAGPAGQRAAMVNAKRRRCVPAAVRRAVFERDGAQCTFVDQQGRRCQQRHFLEFDHVEAHALGGPEAVTNLMLKCAMHNALEAERLFGHDRVKSAIRHAQQVRTR